MKFKAKLRQIGNSLGILIPKEVITYLEDRWSVNVITKGDDIYLDVITDDLKYCDSPNGVITESPKTAKIGPKEVITFKQKKEFDTQWCEKHSAMKGTCGCK